MIVALPAVLSVTLKDLAPDTSAALAGRTALASLEVIVIVSFVLTRFQFASTELTVTVKGVPAVCARGMPLLPVGLPGAVISPGSRICSLANTAAFTVMAALVLAGLVISVTSEAVTVALPIVLRVTLKLLVPAASAAFAGKVALLSEELRLIVSVALLTRFQFASTAFTVTLKGLPPFCAAGVPVLPEAVPGAAASPGTRA